MCNMYGQHHAVHVLAITQASPTDTSGPIILSSTIRSCISSPSCPSIHLSTSICPSVLSVHPSAHPSILFHLIFPLPTSLSVSLCLSLSLCLSVCLCLCLCLSHLSFNSLISPPSHCHPSAISVPLTLISFCLPSHHYVPHPVNLATLS